MDQCISDYSRHITDTRASPSHEKKQGGRGLGVDNEVISHSILRVELFLAGLVFGNPNPNQAHFAPWSGMNKYRLKRVFFLQNYPVLFSGSVSTFAQSQLI